MYNMYVGLNINELKNELIDWLNYTISITMPLIEWNWEQVRREIDR